MADALRVLYAEDSVVDADLTRSRFKAHEPSLDLEVVASGEQCLARLAAATYDVLLLDNRLPDMHGVDVLKKLGEQGPPLPVVVVTAAGDEALVVQLLRLGAWDYVAKEGDYIERLPGVLRNAAEEYRRLPQRSYEARNHSRRILYVEHHVADADLTRRHFAQAACHLRVDVVRSASEALHALTSPDAGPFDLVLTDLRLPDSSALDLLREARRLALQNPFIVITGKGDEEAAVAALKLGAYDYIIKGEGYLTKLPYAIDNAIDRFQLLQLNRRLERELADRQFAETRLRESEARFRSMIEQASDAITIVDERATVIYASPSYERVLGLPAQERIGTNLFERIHPDDLARARKAFRLVVASPGRVDTIQFRLRVGDEWRHLMAVGQNLLDDPAIRGVIINSRDISARVAAEEALRSMNDELELIVAQRTHELVDARDAAETSNRVKDVFLATMSHELRTPLNSIIGFSDLMLSRQVGDLTEEQCTQLAIINRSGRQLLGLISDVLDISKIETGQLTLHLEQLVLNEVLREQQRVFELQAQNRGLGLRFELPDEPIQVLADAHRLRQVIGNLLTNAVKFTDRGEVGLSVAIQAAFARITIFDSGIGIAIADQPKLFNPFQRLKPTAGGTRDGTGLGLAISRRLVEGMGGQIGVDSELGIGSRFWFTVPLATTAAVLVGGV
jgi:PAS domain S-box-containing protein